MKGRTRTKSGLRPIADPFVVAPPKGVRTRTRVRLTPEEEAVLEQIGVFLGEQYRATLVDRIALGTVTMKEQGVWRQVCKQALTASTSSRWAGAITRTAIDSYGLGMRGLNAHVDSLTAAISTLSARLAAPIGGKSPEANRPHEANPWICDQSRAVRQVPTQGPPRSPLGTSARTSGSRAATNRRWWQPVMAQPPESRRDVDDPCPVAATLD